MTRKWTVRSSVKPNTELKRILANNRPLSREIKAEVKKIRETLSTKAEEYVDEYWEDATGHGRVLWVLPHDELALLVQFVTIPSKWRVRIVNVQLLGPSLQPDSAKGNPSG